MLNVLLENGIDPVQVIKLIRQLADYPELRRALFERAGFTLDKQGNFFEVGNDFVSFIQQIYTAKVVHQAFARAA